MPDQPEKEQQEPPSPETSPVEQAAEPVQKSPDRGRAKKLTAEESRARLLDQIEALRTATQEVVEQVSLRLSAQLAEASRRLTGNGSLESPPRRVSTKKSRAMLDIMRKLRLKPKKGRLKDLARIEHAVDELLALTEPE